MRTAFVTTALVTAMLTAGGCASSKAPAVATPPSSGAADPLVELNGRFRAAYAEARARALGGARPVIVLRAGTATLLRDTGRVDVAVDPAVYHSLKAVAHVPLAIYVMLAHVDGAVEPRTLQALTEYRRMVSTVRADVATRGDLAPQRGRQERILRESIDFVDAVVEARAVTRTGLTAFARRVAPLVLANADDAARAQLDTLHARVTAWRRELTPAEWQRLRVVIVGVHMAREGEVATQYFSRLLGEPSEGRRIVYAESLWDEAPALDLLGTHLLDAGIGGAFFDDTMRMHRDLLSDAARDYLPTLLGR
jgi:hypothetical protein